MDYFRGKTEYSMENFIDTVFYVLCEDEEEVEAFLKVCEEHSIKTRSNASPMDLSFLNSAVFAHNLYGPKDGLSYWEGCDPDDYKETVKFSECCFDESYLGHAQENFDDFSHIIGL